MEVGFAANIAVAAAKVQPIRSICFMICSVEVDLESLEERPFRRTIPARRGRRSASEVRISVVERDADRAIQVPVDAAHPFLRAPGRCGDIAESVVEESTLDAEISCAHSHF